MRGSYYIAYLKKYQLLNVLLAFSSWDAYRADGMNLSQILAAVTQKIKWKKKSDKI